MTVRELFLALADADLEAVVVFLEKYADVDESGVIREVTIPVLPWTHELGRYLGASYDVRYPGQPRVDDDDRARTDVIQTREHVVVLSNGPTNLRYGTGN